MFCAKGPSRVRTIDLEPILAGVSRDQPKVVQKGTAIGNFLIDDGAAHGFNNQAAEDICS